MVSGNNFHFRTIWVPGGLCFREEKFNDTSMFTTRTVAGLNRFTIMVDFNTLTYMDYNAVECLHHIFYISIFAGILCLSCEM